MNVITTINWRQALPWAQAIKDRRKTRERTWLEWENHPDCYTQAYKSAEAVASVMGDNRIPAKITEVQKQKKLTEADDSNSYLVQLVNLYWINDIRVATRLTEIEPNDFLPEETQVLLYFLNENIVSNWSKSYVLKYFIKKRKFPLEPEMFFGEITNIKTVLIILKFMAGKYSYSELLWNQSSVFDIWIRVDYILALLEWTESIDWFTDELNMAVKEIISCNISSWKSQDQFQIKRLKRMWLLLD